VDKVKIGFVGVGGMGQCAHLRNYAVLPECEVVAIAEVKQEQGRRVAEKYGVKKVYNSHTEMLENEDLDGIVASQPYSRHGVLLPDLYQSGKPLFTEKPLGRSVEIGEALLKVLPSGGSWHMVGYHKRSDPAAMFAKAEIDRLKETKELGALKYVRVLMPAGDWVASGFAELIGIDEPVPPMEWDAPASDMDEKTYQEYDAFVNFYIHQVNLMRHLLGEPYKPVYADPGGVLMAVQSDSGVTGTIEMSPYTTSVEWQESALVAFEHGYVYLTLPAPMAMNRPGKVEIMKDPGSGVTPMRLSPDLPWVHAMRQQAINFIKAVRGEMKPMCEAAEALEDLKVAREYIRLKYGK
jgi:predicted dehydrogenase